ncbi:class I SAM-dependent methyltransferase [Methylorubrum rhodesianum]|uniref:class I SAM-dependent methyltransferase n=1 Tax=Methylorubrum rhodesianum TaxID=29427 RepID=UPI003D04286A
MLLDEIGIKFGTDKSSKHHDYLNIYDRCLSKYKSKEITLVEVGVYRGGSVATWGEYFPKATIVGLDITPDCTQYANNNVFVRIGDASSSSFLFEVVREFGEPTIFIDDGSHRWDHQISTFQIMFPILKAGGTYIIEDIDTSFDSYLKEADFKGFSAISAYDYVCKLGRMLVGDVAVQSEKPYDLFIADNYRSIESIEMARRTCIIKKR